MIPTWAIVLDYVLGMIMWTLIGRAFMNIFQKEDSTFFFMRVFVKYTNPIINLFKFITPSFYPSLQIFYTYYQVVNAFKAHQQILNKVKRVWYMNITSTSLACNCYLGFRRSLFFTCNPKPFTRDFVNT